MSTQNTPLNEQQAVLYSYLTVNQLCEEYKAFKVGGVRAQIFNAETNGLKESGAIVRKNRKILINIPKWFSWVESPNKAAQ